MRRGRLRTAAGLAVAGLVLVLVPAARAGNGPGEGCVLAYPAQASCTYTATQVASFAGSGRFQVVVTYVDDTGAPRTRYDFVNPGGFFSSWSPQSLMDPMQIGIGDTVTARVLADGAVLTVGSPAALPHTASTGGAAPARLRGDVSPVHDPAIAAAAGRYWLFSTGAGMPMRWSSNLRTWHAAGTVFPGAMPAWAAEKVPGAQDVWAPDVSFFNGRWHLYYVVSTFGSKQSVIGLATAADPGGPWTDQGPVLESGVDSNAIDPNLVLDADGRPWLAFGSFYGGLKLLPVDVATGKPTTTAVPVPLAANPEEYTAVEAAFIVERDGWYYLFASYAYCCRGVDSTYHVRVGRAPTVAGPYVDDLGVPMLAGGGREVLAARGDVRGPGHNAVLRRPGDRWTMVFHYYDAGNAGTPTLGILPLRWTADGWPVVD